MDENRRKLVNEEAATAEYDQALAEAIDALRKYGEAGFIVLYRDDDGPVTISCLSHALDPRNVANWAMQVAEYYGELQQLLHTALVARWLISESDEGDNE